MLLSVALPTELPLHLYYYFRSFTGFANHPERFFYDGFVGAAGSNRKQCFSRTFDVNIAVSVRCPIRFYEPPSRTPRSPHLHGSSVLFTPSTQNFRKEMPQSTAGAGNGIRTRMVSPPADFKSAASTDLTIPADQ